MQRMLKEEPSPLIERWQELSPEEQKEIAARRGETLRSLPRLLRGDLESVALRAVARRPADRYESAQELLADVERCLDHLPVRTRPKKVDQTPSEMTKQAQIYSQLALYDQARRQLEAVRDRLNRIPSDLPALAPIYRELARVALHQDKLDEARTFLDQAWDLGREIPGENERIAFKASVLDHSGQLFRRAKDFAAAEEDHRESIRLLQSASEPDSLELIAAHSNLGMVFFIQERWREAEAQFRTTLDLCRAHLPDGHAITARSLMSLGASLSPQGRAAEAQPLIQEALKSQRQTLRGDRSTVATLLDNLGAVTSDLDDSDRAELAYLAGATVGWRL
jgi:tetratricopeptide (TPR) repeat protein